MGSPCGTVCVRVAVEAPTYSTAIDMWSVGCIMGELLVKKPIIQGQGDLAILKKMFHLVGSPSEAVWPGYSKLPKAHAVRWKKEVRRAVW